MVATDKAAQIKSPADFKGRKLGVTSPGSSTDFVTQYLATKGGLSKPTSRRSRRAPVRRSSRRSRTVASMPA
jgi:hypothetical protein